MIRVLNRHLLLSIIFNVVSKKLTAAVFLLNSFLIKIKRGEISNLALLTSMYIELMELGSINIISILYKLTL